jgi:hypothetical protein
MRGMDTVAEGTYDFKKVVTDECKAIEIRRNALKRKDKKIRELPGAPKGCESVLDTIGLALSGGGIRSAAFCIGALQVLELSRALKKIDYLSTVSGGGYTGCCLTAALNNHHTKTKNKDVPPIFASTMSNTETPTVQHIRDYSNYLFPDNVFDVFQDLGIILRGIAANILLVFPWLLFAAALTLWCMATNNGVDVTANDILNSRNIDSFTATYILLGVGFALLLLWAFRRSMPSTERAREIPTNWTRFIGGFVVIIILCAFFNAQPTVLRSIVRFENAVNATAVIMPSTATTAAPTAPDAKSATAPAPNACALEPKDQCGEKTQATAQWGDAIARFLISWMKNAVIYLAPLAAFVGFISGKLNFIAKRAQETPGIRATLTSVTIMGVIIVAGCIVPLLLWISYLELCYWAIEPGPFQTAVLSLESVITSGVSVIAEWLAAVARPVWKDFAWPKPMIFAPGPVAQAYLWFWVGLVLLAGFLSPNGNSIHRLYRDRLSKAFLIQPKDKLTAGDEEIKPLDHIKLSGLSDTDAPYHLINCALNIQASKIANRRGRNADFFLFSKNYVGSATTGYVRTTEMQDAEPGVDLATVMAVSGAAASSNMGGNTIKPWTLSLAMLDVRLGFWLRNPRYINVSSWVRNAWHYMTSPYFLYEICGLLNEWRWYVYLTDGGHIENLGIYELLRRRCRLIIAVDAEADDRMDFNSLIQLQRYARIDLGIRIELPWQKIRLVSLDTNNVMDREGNPVSIISRAGPHCAIGRIHYPGGEGLLLYVKSSLSGDESDYVMDYKRRNPYFPHETTGDQMFTEEQFEAYRSLGFHALAGVFSGRDEVAMPDTDGSVTAKRATGDSQARMMKTIHKLLGLHAPIVMPTTVIVPPSGVRTTDIQR